ncbi:HNH endonuclease, partial [Mycolicibacterium moriokaense]
ERRAAALAALGAHSALACACAQPDCPAATTEHDTKKNAVLYALADEESVNAARSAAEEAATTPAPATAAEPAPTAEPAPSEAASAPASSASAPASTAGCSAPPAYVFGAGILPTALLGALLERAEVRTVRHPGATAPEPRYTPSRALCEFIRCR